MFDFSYVKSMGIQGSNLGSRFRDAYSKIDICYKTRYLWNPGTRGDIKVVEMH